MSIKTIRKLMSKDPEFVSRFMVTPKETIKDYGIEISSMQKQDVKVLELLAEQMQDNMKTNAKLVGVEIAPTAWGIGSGCCNTLNTSFILEDEK